MARLTKRVGENITYNQERKIECSVYCDECSQGTANCKTVREMVKKLADYEDAEEQRLLLRLPCKVGDVVYRPVPKLYRTYTESVITEINIREKRISFKTDKGLNWEIDTIGRTIFLTKEEAEQVLAEMKGV